MPDCSIIIVSWNVRDLLRRCIASLQGSAGSYTTEIIVVDNDSRDGTVDMLRAEFPAVVVISLDRNMGFARANNRGIAKARGQYICILNPDTEAVGPAFEQLIRYMDMHPAAALVAPQLVNPDGTFQEGSIRRDPTLAAQVIILLKLQHIIAQNHVLQSYYATDFVPAQEQEVLQVMGAAMFIRRTVLAAVGYFDEGFFLWFEEVDLCKRLRDHGFKLQYYPDAKIIHHGGKSFEQFLPFAKQRIYNASAIRYFSKHHGFLPSLVLRLITPINLLIVFFYQVMRKHGVS